MADIGCFSGGGRNCERAKDYFFAFLASADFFLGAAFLEATFSTFFTAVFLAVGFAAAGLAAFAGAFTDLADFAGPAVLADFAAGDFTETGFAFLLTFAAGAATGAAFFVVFLPLNAADQPSL